MEIAAILEVLAIDGVINVCFVEDRGVVAWKLYRHRGFGLGMVLLRGSRTISAEVDMEST